MSELEYNDHFVICLTPRNGTQIICNPDSLRVFFSLVYEEMSVINIAAKLEIPKTTAQNRINRLFKDGILDSRPSDMDARRILYRVCAIPLFIDNNYRPWTCPPSDCISNNKLDDERQYYEYFMSVFAKHVFESGINTWPLFLEAGSALSPPRYEYNFLKILDNEERLLKGLRLQGIPDLTFDITYRAEIVIDIHPKRTMKKDHTLIFGAISGNLITLVQKITGINHCHVVRVQKDEHSRASKITIAPYKGKPFDDTFPKLGERPDSFYRCSKRFAIYSVHGHTYLIANKVMLDILENISDNNNAYKLSQILPYSRISIHSALNKLADIGAIRSTDPDRKKDRIYVLNSKRIMYTETPNLSNTISTIELMKNTPVENFNYYKILNTYIKELIDSIGINMDIIAEKACESIGEMIISRYPDISLEDYIKFVFRPFSDTLALQWADDCTIVIRPRKNIPPCMVDMHHFEYMSNDALERFPNAKGIKVVCDYSIEE